MHVFLVVRFIVHHIIILLSIVMMMMTTASATVAAMDRPDNVVIGKKDTDTNNNNNGIDDNDDYDRDLILGGQNTTAGAYPYFAFSKFGRNNGCGATLIHSDILLTAAHCFTAFNGRGVIVGAETNIAGDVSSSPDAEFHEDELLVQHPEYDSNTLANDIMIIKLQTSSTKTPIRLNRIPVIVPVIGSTLTVIGMGRTAFNGALSSQLLETNLKAVDFGPCQDFFLNQSQVIINETTQFCAYDTTHSGKDACQADSGGPIMNFLKEQVGIVSFGLGCGEMDVPSVYVRVGSYIDWIDEQVCLLSSSPPTMCPTPTPTATPTVPPTGTPTLTPTASPTQSPTIAPTRMPTRIPTMMPAMQQPSTEDSMVASTTSDATQFMPTMFTRGPSLLFFVSVFLTSCL